MQPRTVRKLPPEYYEIFFFRVTTLSRMILLNVVALGLALIALVLFGGWLTLYHVFDAPLVITSLPDKIPSGIGIALVIIVLPLHEGMHGLAIRYFGHPVRYGIKPLRGVLYATSDNALFWRNQFIVVALAPLVVLSLILTTLSVFLPAGISLWLMFGATVNATGAIGDLWMTRIALRYPSDALIEDEEDGMRIFISS